jgi:hypothetical protein
MSGLRSMSVRKWREKRPAVAVAIPMNFSLHRDAVISQLNLVRRIRDDDVTLWTNETAVVSFARNNLVKRFLELPEEVEYLLMLDDDIVVDPATIEKLTILKQDVVSAVYYKKSAPYEPVAYMATTGQPNATAAFGIFGEKDTDYHSIDVPFDKGLFRVDGVGAGCLLVHRRVYAAMEPPWFKFEGSGEDLYFCRKAQRLGYTITLDTSLHLGHVGTRITTHEDWEREGRDTFEMTTLGDLQASIAS